MAIGFMGAYRECHHRYWIAGADHTDRESGAPTEHVTERRRRRERLEVCPVPLACCPSRPVARRAVATGLPVAVRSTGCAAVGSGGGAGARRATRPRDRASEVEERT